MATQRPLKEGNVRTYQEKVALGFPDILASEMDADLDTIYAAWNGNIGTANLIDGSVTTPKLADGNVTTAKLATAPNGVGTTNINDLAVTTPKLADLAVTTAKLANLGVTTAKLAIASSIAAIQNAGITTNYATVTPNTWETVATLPTLTTRGGYIVVLVSAALSYQVVTNAGNIAQLRVLRGATQTGLWRWDVGAGTVGALIPLPAQAYIEAAAAGAYVYVLQANAFNANGKIVSANQGGATGGVWAVELA